MSKMNHYYSDEWCSSEYARSQEDLQIIAKQIRENCKVDSIGNVLGGNKEMFCTIYVNENLGLRYWVHDSFGKISLIEEERQY